MGHRVAVLGRPAFNHIRDEDLLPVRANRGQEPVQELPRGTDEGPALPVFVVPRALANEHQVGVVRAFPGHRIGPGLT